MPNDKPADAETTTAALAAARAILEAANSAVEIAEPAIVVATAEGVRVMTWLPIPREDL